MIEVEAPDGTILEFPDATPENVIAEQMRKLFPAPTQLPAAQPGAPASAPAPPVSPATTVPAQATGQPAPQFQNGRLVVDVGVPPPQVTNEQLRSAVMTGQAQPTERGAPFRVRANVGAVDDPNDRLSTLRNFFPQSVQDPVSGRLVFMNPESGEIAFMNPSGLDTGDLPSIAREGMQAAGGALGAVGGALTSGGTPAALATVPAGAGLGTMAGEELFNLIARATGTVDNRTLGERARETGTLGLVGAGGQAVGAGAGAALRGALQGGGKVVAGGADEIQGAIDDLARFDASPSLAQATQSQFLDGVESLVSKTPGGAGRFRKVVADTTERVTRSIEIKVEALTGRVAVDPEFAGRTVQKGLQEGFVGRFNDTAEELFGRIGIDDATEVGISNTAEAVKGLNIIPEVGAVNSLVTSPTVRSLASAELPEFLPYEVLKRMRSAVGKRIANPSLTSDVPTADLKQVYAAISRDMEAAAAAAGPRASAAFSRANNFYRSGLSRIEDSLQKLANKATPEEIFLTLERGAKNGPTQIRRVMRSLTSGERRILAGGIIRRMGQVRPGQQVAEKTEFGFDRFLTNYQNLDEGAKRAMFDWPELKAMKGDLEALARASRRMRESSKAFANPSGTAGAGIGQTATFIGGGSAVTGALTGQSGLLAFPAVLAMGALSANLTARLMTSRHFVRWLAQSTRIKPDGFAGHLGRLKGVAAASEDKEAILGYLELFSSPQQGAPVSQN